MNTRIPHILEPYIRQCIHESNLTLLTSVLDTPTNWLLIRFLAAALSGIEPESASTSEKSKVEKSPVHSCNVVFVSIWRSFELWMELAAKCRLNLRDAIAQGKLCYVNGLGSSGLPVSSHEPATTMTTTAAMLSMNALTLQELNATVTTALQKFSHSKDDDGAANNMKNVTVVFDGLDFLLACHCQPEVHSMELAHFITNIRHQTHGVIITCAADSALLHNTAGAAAAATPLELEHSIYVRSLAHQASFVFQLRPLETGHSREVSGTIRISRGGSYERVDDGAEESDEGEWLYHVRSDGSVNVWRRGGIR